MNRCPSASPASCTGTTFGCSIDAASRAYFGKPARDLDLAESALLAGLVQAPGDYDPLTNPAAAKARQKTVLELMVKHGYPGEAEAATARADIIESLRTGVVLVDALECVREMNAAAEQLLTQDGYVSAQTAADAPSKGVETTTIYY